jgi:hypothetical protein
LPLCQRALINFGCAPKNKDQRPPVAKQITEFEPAIIVKQNQNAEYDKQETAEHTAGSLAGWGAVGHCALLPLPWIGIGITGGWSGRRTGLRRQNRRIDVPILGSHCGSQKYDADHDKENGKGVADGNTSVAKFTEEKKNSERRDYRGPHHSANGATTARTAWLGAHMKGSSRSSRPHAKFVPEHVQSRANQNQRPQPAQANELEQVKIVEKQQRAETD